MKKLIVGAVLLAVVAAPVAYSDTFYFDGGADGTGTDLTVAANWSNDELPANGTHIGIVGSSTIGTNTQMIGQNWNNYNIIFKGNSELTRTLDAAQRVGGSVLTFEDSASFSMYGSSKDANLVVGRGGSGNATINWNSTGTLNGMGNLGFGHTTVSGQSGYFNQTAGTVVVGADLTLKINSVYTISGGGLSVAGTVDFRDGIEIDAGINYIDFLTTGTTGTVTLASIGLNAVQAFIDNGQIRIDGAIQSDYTGFALSSDGGKGTVLTVIPEPATLGMVAAFGAGILFIRRKLML